MMSRQKIINRTHRIITASILLLVFLNSVITDDITYNAFVLLPVLKNSQYKIITMPELYVAIIILLSYSIFLFLHEFINRKKNAEESENGKNTKKNTYRIVSSIVFCISAIFVFLSLFSLITSKNNDIPEISDGKYLDVHDFGIADKITDTGFKHSGKETPNKITVKKTVSSELTITKEYYHIGEKSFIVYQDILEYKNAKTAQKTAELLSSDKYKNYSEHTADGFDKVYVANENLIAVIDKTVYRITIITTEKSLIPHTEKLLEAIKDNNT